MIQVAFFDTKAYDRPSFERCGREHDITISCDGHIID